MEPGKKGLKVFQCCATGQVEDSSSSLPYFREISILHCVFSLSPAQVSYN